MAGQPTLAVHISLTLRPKSVYSNLAEELLVSGPYPRRAVLDAVWHRPVSTTSALCRGRTGHGVAPGQRRVSAMPL
jgi:hypothetical protein